MSWLDRLFRRPPALTAAQQTALLAYQESARGGEHTALDMQRFVVVDVETSGLDVFSDRLIAIGAVIVACSAVQLGQGFEVVLRQPVASSVDNILVHGIDGTTQTTGVEPADGLLAFLAYLGNAPLVAFHADFDRTMINRATKTWLGMTIHNAWLDLAWIAPALYPELAAGRRALDDWTAVFQIDNLNRHNAVADACATAQLLLIMLARAQARSRSSLTDLHTLEEEQRWLARAQRP